MTYNEKIILSKKKVLVVEDYELNLEIIVEMLKALGTIPDTAVNGQKAFEKVKQGNYDLILMDLRMPVMDGYQATQEIRKLPIPQPLIIALTASSTIKDKGEFEKFGMNDFLIKPIELRDLEKMLNKYFLH